MTDSRDSKEHGMQRVLNKLQSSFSKGDYYEAHQMYRTLYFRYYGFYFNTVDVWSASVLEFILDSNTDTFFCEIVR